MNTPKTHMNMTVKAFLADYFHAGDLCAEFPQVDDIFSGALELKTHGDSATRSLSRQVLFHVLQWCPVIDVESINEATNQQYAYRTLLAYAAVARVVSKALERFIATLPGVADETTTRQEQIALDAPHMAELSALGLA
jgi:hypothetical protein